MSKIHEALKLAEELRTTMPADVLRLWAAEAAQTMRRQHALIVQMAQALSDVLPCFEDYQRGALYDDAESALTEATEYLKAKP